jgi:YidC/Oxa1 family membrane protein insertase
VQYLDGKLKKFNYQNANQEFYTDSVRWIGLRSRYYMVSVWDFSGFVVSFKDGDGITLRLYPKGDKEFFVFFGPAEKRLLSMEPNMGKAFDLGGGWTTFLAWPIYWVLTFFEGLTKNYGIAIILLALFIKLLTSPLSFNMYKASAKMQELKPKLEKIQKLYGNDPERLQWETMKLYREAGFNPFSGCLPLFLQLPIFFALYQVLQNSIELKGAEFVFWINDLSARDPYYVLPIIMGGVSVLNAYLQPNVDPQSKRISILISLLFVFLFLTFPAGIVLYWLTYSLLGILEQRIYKLLWKV